MAAAGKLTPEQQRFWSGHRPVAQFFDCESDPWNLRDLAGDPAHRDRLARMTRALEEFMIRERDLGFWPEPELAEAEKAASDHEIARREPERYPLERLMETAAIEDAREVRARLADPHPMARYWAVVGLAALGGEAGGAKEALRRLLDDPAASVRVEAAHLLAHLSDRDIGPALDLLSRELDSDNEWAAARAGRALELLGEKARPKLAEMRRVLRERSDGFFLKPKGPRPVNYGLEFSLFTALERFGDQPLQKAKP